MNEQTPVDDERRSGALRLALLALVLVGVLIVAAVAGYLYVQWSRTQPPDVAMFPGATVLLEENAVAGQDHQQYSVVAPVSEVERFYIDHDLTCEPQYASVTEDEGGELVREGYIFTRCLVDRSLLGFTQYAVILIQPRYDPAQLDEGEVVIDVKRYWSR